MDASIAGQVRHAVAERDAEIAEAVQAGASQTDIARVLGLTRQAIYTAIQRARDQ
jgi:biotin operon repressor